ncbi:MAG: siderophore transport transcriptional regulator MmpR5 [Anaerolineae bacterium]
MDDQHQFIEDMGLYFEATGLTRMAGRIIGWLLICDPAHQSMPDIITALSASKSAISTALALLRQLDLVDIVRLPNERKDHFKLNADLWSHAFQARAHQIAELRTLSERGLALLEDAPPEMRRRLQLMYEMNVFMEAEFRKLIERWNEVKQEKGLADL